MKQAYFSVAMTEPNARAPEPSPTPTKPLLTVRLPPTPGIPFGTPPQDHHLLSVGSSSPSRTTFLRSVVTAHPETKATLHLATLQEDGDDGEEAEIDESIDTSTSDLLHSHPSAARFGVSEENAIKAAEIRWKVEHSLSQTEPRGATPLSPHLDPLEASKSITFRRINPSGADSPIDSPEDITTLLLRAMKIRQKYMTASRQAFPKYIAAMITKSGSRSRNVSERELDIIASQSSLNALEHSASLSLPTATWAKPHHKEPASVAALKDISTLELRLVDGVYNLYHKSNPHERGIFDYINAKSWRKDIKMLLGMCVDGPTKSFTFQRLQFLASKFNMHRLMNDSEETLERKKVPHRDFYNVRKVDTHVHLSSCMNQKHLLRFIKDKLKKFPNDVVINRDGKDLTLSEVFASLKLSAYDLSIDTLDVHADRNTFHRFDKFNLKYNPIGESRLREIFLKVLENNKNSTYFLANLSRLITSSGDVIMLKSSRR